MFSFPLILTIYAGFTHAFEADHLLAVSSIVSRRNNLRMSLKDGIFWGLGHASTIFFLGILMILFKVAISVQYFNYFEAAVGLLLIVLAIYRLAKYFGSQKIITHAHSHAHAEEERKHLYEPAVEKHTNQHEHSLAYGVGLVHGLAGSGALIVVVLAQMKDAADGLIYLVIFGLGCICGMFLASGLFSIPFSKKIMHAQKLRGFLIITSSVLCLLYGSKVVYENLNA